MPMDMRLPSLRSVLTLVLATLALGAAVPAAASAKPLIGLGDQHAETFSDPRFTSLGLKTTRFTLSWDWYKDDFLTGQFDAWVKGAQAAGVKPLVAFNRNWRKNGDRYLPTKFAYLKSFRLIRERYPHITDFSAWNEANHTSQPTAKKPRKAANYYNWLREACRTCTIVAADVLDSSDMPGWITTFKRFAKKPRIWGLHNYKDANNATTFNTRGFLRLTKGQVWLTETGGIKRLKPHPGSKGNGRSHTLKQQAQAVKRVFTLAKMSSRIRRVYFYQWKEEPSQRWDSAFVTRHGKARPALSALRAGVKKLR
jgi:hypothetical protein